MRKADPEECRKDERVISQDTTDEWVKNGATTKLLETVDRTKVKDCDHDRKIASLKFRDLEEIHQLLYTFDCPGVSGMFDEKSLMFTYRSR